MRGGVRVEEGAHNVKSHVRCDALILDEDSRERLVTWMDTYAQLLGHFSDEQEREHRVAGFALWRPLNRLALLGRLPYNIKQVTDRVGPAGPDTQTSRGVGDVELTVLAGVARRAGRRPMTLGLVLGGTAPTGSNEARDASGERLDIHLQPGIGAWSNTTGLNLAMSGARGTWNASVLNRISGTSTHGYRYGETVLYNVGFTSYTWKGLQLLAQVNGRWAARDRLESGRVGENTGGLVTYAAPGMRWLIAWRK